MTPVLFASPDFGASAMGALVLCFTGVGALVALIALLMAFVSRRSARILAALAPVSLLFSAWVIFSGNHWNVGWALRVLFASELTLPSTAVMAVAALAAFVPLSWRGDDTEARRKQVSRNRWLVSLGVGVPLVAIVVAVSINAAVAGHGEQKLRTLLRGNGDIRLEYWEINNQQRRMICTDPDVLRYLEERLRASRADGGFGGTSYEFTLRFEGGGRHVVPTTWANDGFALPREDFEDWQSWHRVTLPHPLPPSVAEIVWFLEFDHMSKGNVLIVGPGEVRYEYDRSLVAR